jgi:hypothetical protein
MRATSAPPRRGQSSEPAPSAVGKRVSDASASEEPASTADVRPAGNLTELTPRAVAPEKQVDLSAMRELANFSAKAAIERHARSLLARAGGSKLFMALIGAACGGALYWMGTCHEIGSIAIPAAAVSFVVAIVWGLQYAAVTGRLIVTRSGDSSSKPAKETDAKAP